MLNGLVSNKSSVISPSMRLMKVEIKKKKNKKKKKERRLSHSAYQLSWLLWFLLVSEFCVSSKHNHEQRVSASLTSKVIND